MSGFVRIAIVLALAAVATIVANVVLLGVAAGPQDPVGRLSPPVAAAAVVSSNPTSPSPSHRLHEAEHSDD